MNKIKKAVCLLLSLVMLVGCLVIPTAALADGKTVGFILTADKEYASAGDVITYTLYVDADPTVAYTNMAIYISYDSSVFVQPKKTNLNRTFLNDFAGYYKEGSTVGTGSANVSNAFKSYYTTEEAAMYNAAFQLQGTCDTSLGTLGDGFYITDSTTPQMTFTMTVADGVADGTKLNVGLSAAGFNLTSRGAFIKEANGTSSPASVAVNSIDFTASATTVTIGEAAAPTVELKFSDVKNQIRFDKTADGKYANTFDGRMIVSIDNLEEVLGCKPTTADDTKAIKKIGFLYAKNGAITEAEALTQVKTATAANNYTVTNEAPYSANVTGGGYISTGFTDKANNPVAYAVTGIIHNIPDADNATAVSGAVYAIYDSNGDGVDEYTVYVLNSGATFTFEDLYSRNFNTAFPA